MTIQQFVRDYLDKVKFDRTPPGPVLPTEIVQKLEAYNTAPESDGQDILYGPGIRVEMPPGEPVTQMLMTVVEEEIAWQVIMRLAKGLHWKLLDPATGRELNP